jgi:hypothetical protein
VDVFLAPLDSANGNNYLRTSGQAFGPASYNSRYVCQYSAPGQSAADRMSNGNIFVNTSGGQGGAGIMYEVDQNENIVWQYNGGGPAKAFRYECEHPGIISLLNNPCSVGIKNTKDSKFSIYPNPSKGVFNIDGLTKSFTVNIFNVYGKLLSIEISNAKVNLSNQPNGIYLIKILDSNGNFSSKKIILNKNEY